MLIKIFVVSIKGSDKMDLLYEGIFTVGFIIIGFIILYILSKKEMI